MLDTNELINRFGYHRATIESAPKHAHVRELMLELAMILNNILPEGRDKSLALTKLQEVMHWSNSAIAMQNDVDMEHPDLPNSPSTDR